MPKLWSDTIDAHRREVRRAIVETAAALVAERGAAAITMSEIADAAGIGRATLYKYFADVESILDAWHEDHVNGHLEMLAAVRDRGGTPGKRLAAVLEAYGSVLHERARVHDLGHRAAAPARAARASHSAAHANVHGAHAHEIAALVHRRSHVDAAQRRLEAFFQDVLKDAAKAGDIRNDIPTRELATFSLHALAAAGALGTRSEIKRLVAVTLSALRTPARPAS